MVNMPTPTAALGIYKHLVEENEQALPVLLYGTEEGASCLGVQIPDEGAQAVLPEVIAWAKVEIGAPKWMVFSAESWMTEVTRDENGDWIPGERSECVSIVGISASEGWSQMTSFRREAEGVVWGEPVDCPPQGGLADIMLAALR